MAGHQIFVYCIWTKLNLFFCDLLYVFLSLVEMVRQRRCFKKSQNLENFWYLCRRGLFQSSQIPTEGTGKIRKGSQNAVTWKKMHFQVCIFLYQSVFRMDKDSHSDRSFVHLDQRPIGRCKLPWAKTVAASKWPLRTTWALLFWHTWPAEANWTLL